MPSRRELAAQTRRALANMRYPLLQRAALPPRPGQPPRPVPERVGEPSVFKHVIYIIKENRTYDQVLGDVKEGNGDPSLCVFGEGITPWKELLAAAESVGGLEYFLIEQEGSRFSEFETAKKCLENWKRMIGKA